jgi:hypothetical protein
MRSNSFRLSLALFALFLLAAPALAQGTGAQAPPAAEDRYVSQKGFGNRIFEVRHRDPQSVARALSPLGSGFRGATVSPNSEFRTISVRDFPENIAVIEEALRRLDTPETPRPGVEFQVYLLVASNDAAPGELPAGLNDVAARLRSTLGYKSLSLMGTQVLRSKERSPEAYNKGVAEMRIGDGAPAAGSNLAFYNYTVRQVSLDGEPGRAAVRAEEFSFDIRVPLTRPPGTLHYESVGFKNPVQLREGERVVAGTTSVGDKSVVVVLSAAVK